MTQDLKLPAFVLAQLPEEPPAEAAIEEAITSLLARGYLVDAGDGSFISTSLGNALDLLCQPEWIAEIVEIESDGATRLVFIGGRDNEGVLAEPAAADSLALTYREDARGRLADAALALEQAGSSQSGEVNASTEAPSEPVPVRVLETWPEWETRRVFGVRVMPSRAEDGEVVEWIRLGSGRFEVVAIDPEPVAAPMDDALRRARLAKATN